MIRVLEAAHYRNREDHLPLYRGGSAEGGTFSVTGGQGVNVTIEWWNATEREIAARTDEIADVLRDEGLDVERRGVSKLYVPYRTEG